jgi:hypothetical protein
MLRLAGKIYLHPKIKRRDIMEHKISFLGYDDDPDTKSLLEDEEFNQNKNEVFLYLEKLRESGQTYLFGAVNFIQADFECSQHMARRYLVAWMQGYKDEEE